MLKRLEVETLAARAKMLHGVYSDSPMMVVAKSQHYNIAEKPTVIKYMLH